MTQNDRQTARVDESQEGMGALTRYIAERRAELEADGWTIRYPPSDAYKNQSWRWRVWALRDDAVFDGMVVAEGLTELDAWRQLDSLIARIYLQAGVL